MGQHTLWKTLSCDLLPEEVATYSQELAIITTEQSEIEAEKKEVMSTFTARLNKCIADGRVLARKITTRKEDRQVECDLEFDYAKGMVYTVRLDTGVTISQRKLTDDERQERLDFEGEEERQQELEETRSDSPEPVCPKCEGDGFYIEDGIDNGGGEVFCDCPAGIAAQKENAPTNPICQRCHSAHPDCGACCKLCLRPCNAAQVCLVEEAELEQQEATEAEESRRDAICKDWRDCEHKDICFTDQNEEDGHCFVSNPEKIPQSSQPADDHDKDGVTFEKMEHIQVELPKKITNIRAQIIVVCGVSGMWYVNTHLHTPDGGSSGLPWPSLSDKYASRYDAIKDGAEGLWNDAITYIKDQKKLVIVQEAIKSTIAGVIP